MIPSPTSASELSDPPETFNDDAGIDAEAPPKEITLDPGQLMSAGLENASEGSTWTVKLRVGPADEMGTRLTVDSATEDAPGDAPMNEPEGEEEEAFQRPKKNMFPSPKEAGFRRDDDQEY